MRRATFALTLLGIALAAALTAAGCGTDGGSGESSSAKTIPQPTRAQLAAANLDIHVAPESERVDVAAPTFSNPTKITNPLFPISDLHSAVLSGKVDAKRFHTETTLLPETRIIEWPKGQQVETLVSQYVAYSDGRIEEVALDSYAQADDGSVWYLGEDVFNYRDGLIADTAGTWLAGREGPPALIMPADPQIGDVYRPENIPGLVFEEVTVKALGKTVDGPAGPVKGAIIAGELHQDGTREDKTFAPGYGEFFTGSGGDVEAMALAVPTDALDGPPPAELTTLSSTADELFAAARSGDWKAAAAGVKKATTAWEAYPAGQVPPRLAVEMNRALKDLGAAVDARDESRAGTAAIDVAQSTLDLALRHRPPAEIDRARFELWARQILVDAPADDLGAVAGDLVVLELIRDRFVHTLDKVDATRVDAHLLTLRDTVVDEDLAAASDEADRLRDTLAGLPG